MGLIFLPATTMSLAGLQGKDAAQAAGLTSMVRQLGGSFGVALVGTFIERSTAYHRADLAPNLSLYDPETQERLRRRVCAERLLGRAGPAARLPSPRIQPEQKHRTAHLRRDLSVLRRFLPHLRAARVLHPPQTSQARRESRDGSALRERRVSTVVNWPPMTDEMRELLAREESETLEYKKSTAQRTEAAHTVTAMLNGRGGFVVFGVDPSTRQPVGQQVAEKTLRDVVHELRKLEPFIPLHPETVEVGHDRALIVLRVPVGHEKPYTLDGRAYVRQGPTTLPMPRSQFDRLILERQHLLYRWETQPATGISLADLDAAEITRTIDEAIRRGRLDEPGTRDPRELLRSLQLVNSEDVPLNAAAALFLKADKTLPHFPQLVARLARFRGTTMTSFEDNRQIHGNLFYILTHAQRFLRENLPVAGRIVPNLFERLDDPLYPPEALREALANALCHRDYAAGGGAVNIAIFDDRLEITSTGQLHFGLTPADLRRTHQSRPWNPLIAGVCFRRGVVESWGRGTIRIINLVEKAGLASPEFEETAGAVTVRFRPTNYLAPSRVEHDLTPLQHRLLQIVGDVGRASLSDIVSHYPLPRPADRAIQAGLQQLRVMGALDLIGFGRGARWQVKDDKL